MKLILAGIALLVAIVSVGVGCGPKEKYCYQEMQPCKDWENHVLQDAAWEAPPDGDDAGCTTFSLDGSAIPCSPG